MAMAALAKALRGRRRSGASPHPLPLLPGIGRRAPLEGVAGPLLPRLGATGGAGGIGRRLLSEASPTPWSDTLKKKYYISGGGRYEPYDSEVVMLDIARRLENIEHKFKVHKKRMKYAAALAAVPFLLLAYLKHQNKKNCESLSELEADMKQRVSLLDELHVLHREVNGQIP